MCREESEERNKDDQNRSFHIGTRAFKLSNHCSIRVSGPATNKLLKFLDGCNPKSAYKNECNTGNSKVGECRPVSRDPGPAAK